MLSPQDDHDPTSNFGDDDLLKHDELKDLALKYTEKARSVVDAASLSTIIGERSLVISCFHLPIELTRKSNTWSVKWNDSLIARSDQSVSLDTNTYWIGTVNPGRDRILSEGDRISIRNVLSEIGCIPIFAPQELIDRAYLGYCKQQLWPSFHNVDLLDLTHACWNGDACISNPELSWDQSSVQGHWEAYLELNSLFSNEYTSMMKDTVKHPKGSVLWVHDYHLMLLPRMVANQEVKEYGDRQTKIVFFLHIPFSTSQIFRSIQHGGELLEGMVHSDAVGFHAFDHARHFLNACKRNLGLKFQTRVGGLLGVEFEGRTVSVLMRHVSIETAKVDREIIEYNAQEHCDVLKKKHLNKKLIAGLDTCQRLSGVALKLLGFENLLDEYEKWRNEVVLVQRCLRPRNRLDDEERTSIELNRLVSRINFKYPGSVDYEEFDGLSTLPTGLRQGLWLASDVMLNTAVRESLNMDCLEYIYVKKAPPGVLVASEFGSTVSVLSGALRINPFDLKTWKITLDESLRMSLREREARKFRDIEYVISRPSPVWTKQIINDMMSTSSTSNGDGNDDDAFIFSEENESGEGTGQKFQTGTKAFSKLEISNVIEAYQTTSRRLFVFDFAGTLRDRERVNKFIKNDDMNITKSNNHDISADTLQYLKILSDDPNNTVYIISELGTEYMEETFRDLPNVGLAARDGLCYCLASHSITSNDDHTDDGHFMNQDGAMDESNISNHSASSTPPSISTAEDSSPPPPGRGRTRTSSLGSLLDMSHHSPTNRPSPSPPSSSVSGSAASSKPGSLKPSSSLNFDMSSLVRGASGGDLEALGKLRNWYTPDLGVDWPTIKSIALPLLNRYTGRTNGSSIRFREPSLAWSYYRADPDEGLMQATKLKQELTDALAPFNVLIQHGVGELDIIPKYLHQGAFMKHVMQITSETNGGLIPDFMLVVGDGASDERMFSSVLNFVSAQFKPPPPSRLYTSAALASLPNDDDDDDNDYDIGDHGGGGGDGGIGGQVQDAVSDSPVKDNERISDVSDDYENPLSIAAELMLDDTTITCLHSATEDIINQAANQQKQQEQAANNTSSPTNNNHVALENIIRRESFLGGDEVDTRMFTCTVGKKASCAGAYLESVRDVQKLLQALSDAV